MERIVKFFELARISGGFVPEVRAGNYRNGFEASNVPPEFRPMIDELLKDQTFFVFTDVEIEQKLNEVTNRHTSLSEHVDQKLVEHEAKLRADVVQAINDLPQRVLNESAATALTDLILVRLREEMAQMRKDLQGQIDVLRAAQPNL